MKAISTTFSDWIFNAMPFSIKFECKRLGNCIVLLRPPPHRLAPNRITYTLSGELHLFNVRCTCVGLISSHSPKIEMYMRPGVSKRRAHLTMMMTKTPCLSECYLYNTPQCQNVPLSLSLLILVVIFTVHSATYDRFQPAQSSAITIRKQSEIDIHMHMKKKAEKEKIS